MHLLLHRKFPEKSVFYSKLIDQCLQLKKPKCSVKLIHAHLIKLGFNSATFLGNRCVDLYSKAGLVSDALNAFDDIAERNIFSWNICLDLYVKAGDADNARNMFDHMPERDVVSWNSMISGYVSGGFWEKGVEAFLGMQRSGFRPSGFTFSILVSSVKCAYVGKEVHCSMIRNGVDLSNVVVGNSLVDMYGKTGLLEYAIRVFQTMDEVDVVSWNSLICGCTKSGADDLALDEFVLMRREGYVPDEYTVSVVIMACSDLRNLEKGKQILCYCVKMGCFSNTIVSGSAIDFLSKCNRLEDSVHIFGDSAVWDSALCNSMISSYARHGLEGKALSTFVLSLRENIRPTEFTLSSVVKSASTSLLLEQGSQVHCLVVKSGFDLDSVVASALMDMYSKLGLAAYSLKIFKSMDIKDLISWNTIIMGLASSGEVDQSIICFMELLRSGVKLDHITFSGVLLACSYGIFLEEGMAIFPSMEEYLVSPRDEHYAYVVDMFCRAGKLTEAVALIEKAPFEPTVAMWESILGACRARRDMKLVEEVAEAMIELGIGSCLAYSVLADAYERSGRWESLVRIRRLIKGKEESVCRSWICLKNIVYVFETNQMVQHQGIEVCSLLRLVTHEMQHASFLNQVSVDCPMVEDLT